MAVSVKLNGEKPMREASMWFILLAVLMGGILFLTATKRANPMPIDEFECRIVKGGYFSRFSHGGAACFTSKRWTV